MEETQYFIFYDIKDDKTRTKVGEKCKDFGFSHIQFSGYCGTLPQNMRETFIKELQNIVMDKEAVLLIQPICARCSRESITISTKESKKLQKPKIYFGMKVRKNYQDDYD
jgi:CRISPR-associated protein Cas2